MKEIFRYGRYIMYMYIGASNSAEPSRYWDVTDAEASENSQRSVYYAMFVFRDLLRVKIEQHILFIDQ